MSSKEDRERLGKGTHAVWAGEEERLPWGATCMPVVHSVTYSYDDLDQWFEVATGVRQGYIYSRNTNPTVAAFEEKMRALEGADDATSFATGMAAISNTLYTLLSDGDRVVSVKDSYGGTLKVFTEFLPRHGVEVMLCETEDHDAIEAEVRKGCSVLYLETPTNPTMKILDLARLAEVGHEVGATVVVDNTFNTPINQSPLELGADLVLYSATKYLNGHSDAMGGVAIGAPSLVRRVFHFREINGATLHPNTAYLLLRGLKTLELRMQRHNENAMRLARHLVEHPKADVVNYPGLPGHRYHEVAARQMRGFGGMLSFSLKGGFDAVRRFLPKLRFAHRAASLGSVGTLVGAPGTTSHVEVPIAEREAAGIPEGLVRVSVGIENADDLIADFDQALDAV
ncbi:MAG TPA: cystathionine gamma-synthase family protein [Sandaracinaceae bacterium LLY-WYZ-13_1]|nr:cystathionine gamma-synthase family protein [Sandaracinaceae bacterium LLY-WYZ-13_1]